MNLRNKNNTSDVNDEVEELLRAAEDAALLKLTVDSHTLRPSSSDLHPDLDLRFRNLMTGAKPKAKADTLTKKTAPLDSAKVKDDVDDDDLLARFAALKASIPKPPTSTLSSLVENVNLLGKDIVEDHEEDEVEKVIRWAMDAARLDPSPSSDDDEEEAAKDDDFDDSEKSDEDAYTRQGHEKSKRK